jgi:hypothetical protein
MNPERLGCAGPRYPVNKRKRSLRDIAAEPEARGHFNEAGKRYAATAISRMLASPCTATPDALSLALRANPQFKVVPRSGKALSSLRRALSHQLGSARRGVW